jgi:hypothetical protein
MSHPSEESTAITPAAMTLIEPAAEIDQLVAHWQKVQEIKRRILEKDDVAVIQGRTSVKRSGWRKMAAAFAISDRIVSKEREDLGNGDFLWRIEVEAFHPTSGRSMTGVAVCSSKERKFAHPDHDIFAISHTRAINRAISDLVGLGEVSAEEIDGTPEPPSERPIARSLTSTSVTGEDLTKEPQQTSLDLCKCGHRLDLHGGKKGVDYTCMVGTAKHEQCQCESG